MGGLNDMAKLDINIGALSLKNPVLTASGTFGYGEEFADFIVKAIQIHAWPKRRPVCSMP